MVRVQASLELDGKRLRSEGLLYDANSELEEGLAVFGSSVFGSGAPLFLLIIIVHRQSESGPCPFNHQER